MTKTEVKREIAEIICRLTQIDFNNPLTPTDAYKQVIDIIDSLDESKPLPWNTEPPKEDGDYIVQLKTPTGVRVVKTAPLSCGCWVISDKYIDYGFTVEAWMELPEFYNKEEK